MSNWFEKNPTKTVIVHTIFVAAATWASFYFIFDENKVNFYEAKVERSESAARAINARNKVLATRVEYLTKENEKFLRWLENEPKTIPCYEKKIKDLEQKLTDAKLNPKIETESKSTNSKNKQVNHIMYRHSETLKSGQAFVDPKTKAVLGISYIDTDATARVNVTLPNGKNIKEGGVFPGTIWKFNFNDSAFILILESVEWALQEFKVAVIEEKTN